MFLHHDAEPSREEIIGYHYDRRMMVRISKLFGHEVRGRHRCDQNEAKGFKRWNCYEECFWTVQKHLELDTGARGVSLPT